MAMRMYEYKIHIKVLQTHAQWLDIDMTTVSDVGLAPWLFNLNIDPKGAISGGPSHECLAGINGR